MGETRKQSIARNLSSSFGDTSPSKFSSQSESVWRETINSEAYHSTPKLNAGVGGSGGAGMPGSMSYPTLLPQHSSEPPTLTSHQSYTMGRSPLPGPGKLTPSRRNTSVKSLTPSPQTLQSSTGSLLQNSSPPKSKSYTSELENTTIQKQRRELQLLIRELQDRDRELNEMVASHQRQLLAWEQDRQKLLAMETRCARYEGELKNRTEYVKSLKTRLKVLASQDQSKACALETVQKQLRQLSDNATAANQRVRDVEEENGNLNASIRKTSMKVGQLEAREQELMTVVKLKDKDLLDASSHISDLSGRLKKLDLAHKEARHNGQSERKQVEELKMQLTESRAEVQKLRGDLADQVNTSTEQRIETGKLQESLKNLETELELAAERERRKDQLLDLQRSKQERTDAELTALRQAYERQHRDLSLLQLNVESQRERSKTENPLRTSLDGSSLFDSKSNTPVKGHLSTSLSPVSGVSPRVSSAGEGRGAVNNHNNVETAELSDTNHSEQFGMSPTSKLHRLLTESRQMVQNLEQSTLPPYIANNSSQDNQDKPNTRSPSKSASFT